MMTNVRIPLAVGTVNYTALGAGTHGGYRLTDRFSGSVDLTSTLFSGPMNMQTAEAGGRFSPLPFNTQLRPFFDLRASYLRVYDSQEVPDGQFDYARTSRYSRGLGGITGAGLEYSLTSSFALMTELAAIRARMTTYSSSAPTSIPAANGYWMTSYRLAVGLRYSARRSMNIKQKPH